MLAITASVCSIPDCGRGPTRARGWCARHYQRYHKYGDPLGGQGIRPAVPIESHPGESKRCIECREVKPLSEFYRVGGKGHLAARPRPRCKPCHGANAYEWRKKTPGLTAKYARKARLARFQITVEEYEAMVKAQDGRCAICRRRSDEIEGRKSGLCVDHDHDSGKTRALLCSPCNVALGMLGDDAERLRTAAAYLEAFKC